MHFKIIVPMYNVENWIETTVKSVLSQTHSNFQCIIADDMSTDSSFDIVNNLIKNDNRFLLIKNTEKKFPAGNIANAIDISNPSDEDVLVTLDGDDWFPNEKILQKLKNVYEKQNCWMTYGNHINYPDGLPYWSLFKYPDDVIKNNSFREFRFLASHLRTYKYKLWKRLDKKDLMDNNGNYFQMAGDLAIMFPLLEMSGDKSYFIEDVMYVYNNQNPLNEYKIDAKLQMSRELLIRTKKKYKPLENI